jgi:hypothetical protein
MANFVNCTPHTIAVHNKEGSVTEYLPSGLVPRVEAVFGDFNEDGIWKQTFGEVEDMPVPVPGTYYIVSTMVLNALKGTRPDVVAPATGHPNCKRAAGYIVSVPGFVQ